MSLSNNASQTSSSVKKVVESSAETIKNGLEATKNYINKKYDDLKSINKDKPLEFINDNKKQELISDNKIIDNNISTDVYKNEKFKEISNLNKNSNEKDDLTNIRKNLDKNVNLQEQNSTFANLGESTQETKEFAKNDLENKGKVLKENNIDANNYLNNSNDLKKEKIVMKPVNNI